MKIRCTVLLLLILVLCAGCSTQKLNVKKPKSFAAIEDFRAGPSGGVDLVWSTGRIIDLQTLQATLRTYDSLMLGQTWLVVDKRSALNLDDKQALTLSGQMVEAIKARFGQSYKLVEKPSRETLRLSIALTNLETPAPILTVTNSLQPETLGMASLSKIVIGEETGSHGTTVELLVSDASTHEPLILVIDRRFGNSVLGGTTSKDPDGVQEAISQWLDRLWTTLSYWNWI